MSLLRLRKSCFALTVFVANGSKNPCRSQHLQKTGSYNQARILVAIRGKLNNLNLAIIMYAKIMRLK